MTQSSNIPVQLPHEDPTLQFGKEMYYPNFNAMMGYGGELTINNGVMEIPSKMYEPRSFFARPMQPNGINLSEFDLEPMYNLINLNRVEGNDTAYELVDPTYTQPPYSSYQEDNYYANQMGSQPSLARDNNMLLVGNNLLQNSIFLG